MDRTKVSGTLNVGSIPAGAIFVGVGNKRKWLIRLDFAENLGA